MEPIKCAFVGLGRFAVNKCVQIANDDRIEIVAGVELSSCAVARFRGCIGNLCFPVFRSIKELLTSTTPDIILITTTANSHIDLAKSVIEEDPSIPILIEKPISNNLASADELLTICKDQLNVRIGIDYPRRASELYRRLKLYLHAAHAGSLKSIEITCSGTVGMNGSHMFDLACMFVDSEFDYLIGDLRYDGCRQLRGSEYKDLFGNVFVKFKNGCGLKLNLGIFKETEQKIKFIFEKGFFSITNRESLIETSLSIKNTELETIKILSKQKQSYEDWFFTVYSIINDDKSCYCTIPDSLRSMELVLASFIAYKKGKKSTVKFPLDEYMRNDVLPIA